MEEERREKRKTTLAGESARLRPKSLGREGAVLGAPAGAAAPRTGPLNPVLSGLVPGGLLPTAGSFLLLNPVRATSGPRENPVGAAPAAGLSERPAVPKPDLYA